MEQLDPKIVDASPTKDFFITMIVRDIELSRAVADLVDNSIDGALRVRGQDSFEGLWVKIDVGRDRFRIRDNCGGIDVDVARDYAFRFGRPKGAQATPHSIGQFGVGMKRALFKMGRHFRIESSTERSRFVIDVDVDSWRAYDDWTFEFAEVEIDLPEIPLNERGTSISVTRLHDSVIAEFDLEAFQFRLRRELEAAHQRSILKGLSVSLNDTVLESPNLRLLSSDTIKPAFARQVHESDPPVEVRIYAGVAESRPEDAGWYVFCNGRLVLKADQSPTTGWGQGSEIRIPKYHNQFSRFRGFAFFESEDAGLLPWTTTKSNIDLNSPLYRSVRSNMINLTRPVVDFLNKLDAENDQDLDSRPLNEIVTAANAVSIDEVTQRKSFWARVGDAPTREVARISYSRRVDQVEAAKQILGATSNKEVGERTFDYFIEMEGDS